MQRVADDNFNFDQNGKKVLKIGKTLLENKILLVMSNFSVTHNVFKRLVLQRRKNKGLSGKGPVKANQRSLPTYLEQKRLISLYRSNIIPDYPYWSNTKDNTCHKITCS